MIGKLQDADNPFDDLLGYGTGSESEDLPKDSEEAEFESLTRMERREGTRRRARTVEEE